MPPIPRAPAPPARTTTTPTRPATAPGRPATTPAAPTTGWKPAPIQLDKSKVMTDFMAVQKAENSSGTHLSFLDRGLASSPFKGAAPQVWESFGVRADGQTVQSSGAAGFSPFPTRGAMVQDFRPMPFLGPSIKQAAVVVGSEVDGAMQAADFWSLGLGNPFPVSGLHGTGMGDVMDELIKPLPPPPEEGEGCVLRLLMGR